MATAALIPIAEYLSTTYHPDCEYIDGEVLERNVGKWDHGRVQALLASWFEQHEDEWQIQVATEARTQVSSSRVRIPDLILVPWGEQPEVITAPPLLVVEILSPDDTYSDTQRRAEDYLRMGVRTVWIIDPATRSCRVSDGEDWLQRNRPEVAGTQVYADLEQVFTRLRRTNL